MNAIKAIRERLSLTQEDFGKAIGCSQGNVGQIERFEQTLLPERAVTVIDIAKPRGLSLTLDMVYGREPLPAHEKAGA